MTHHESSAPAIFRRARRRAEFQPRCGTPSRRAARVEPADRLAGATPRRSTLRSQRPAAAPDRGRTLFLCRGAPDPCQLRACNACHTWIMAWQAWVAWPWIQALGDVERAAATPQE